MRCYSLDQLSRTKAVRERGRPAGRGTEVHHLPAWTGPATCYLPSRESDHLLPYQDHTKEQSRLNKAPLSPNGLRVHKIHQVFCTNV